MRCVALGLLIAASLSPTAQAQEAETIVFLAPRGPFFLRVETTIDGADFREWLTGYLFGKMDTNRDGKLARKEAMLMPSQLLTRLGFENAERFAEQFASDEKTAGKDEFVAFLTKRLPTSFLISERRQSAVQTINVLPKFDANKDDHLSEEELKNALAYQAQQDIDDDEALSAAELLPFQDPQAALAPPNPDDVPFIQIVKGSESKLAARLVRFYSTLEQKSQLTQASTRLSAEQFEIVDANSDGVWDVDETAAFLKEPQHHFAVNIRFSRRGRAKMKYEVLTKDPSVSIAKNQKRTDRVELKLDKLPLSIRSAQYINSGARFTRSFCGQRFSVSDKDRNKSLDDKEFPEFASSVSRDVGNLVAEELDQNDDKLITREELFQHLDRTTIASQSQLEVTVSSDGRSMFQMLDTNLDRRLSLRELREGFGQLDALDQNSDRRVSRIEASTPSKYTLLIGLGQPQLFRGGMNDMMMGMDRTNTIIRRESSLPGPLWFRKMDRNRDGDVSKREFLGSLQQFQKLDTDKDELLSAEEAEVTKSPDNAAAK